MDQEVKRMLEMKALYIQHRKDVVTSSIFTVAKKNGKRRPVHNLLTKDITAFKYGMEATLANRVLKLFLHFS